MTPGSGAGPLRVLVAVKRVADATGEVVLTPDGQGVDGRFAGWAISEADRCAVELAVRVAEASGGSTTVATVGPPEAEEQLRGVLALGVAAAVLVETDPLGLGPADVARELAAVVTDTGDGAGDGAGQGAGQDAGGESSGFDLLLLGNDAADTGDFQVPVRLAHALGLPVVTGVRTAEVDPAGTPDADPGGTRLTASVQGPRGRETYALPLPAVLAVAEGGVEPRYPSLRGRMAAKKVEIDHRKPAGEPTGAARVRWRVPEVAASGARVLGEGPEAAPALVDVLAELGVLR